MAVLSWGKNSIKITPITGTGASVSADTTFDKIVEGSTELTTTQGDKTEAKLEGGALEAVRYANNSYELVWQVRAKAGDYKQLTNSDGVVSGEFSLVLTPENDSAPGIKFARCSINVQTSYSSADGIITTYTATALKPESGAQCEITKGSTDTSEA